MKTILVFILIAFLQNSIFAQCNPDAGPDDQVCGLTYTLSGNSGIVGSNVSWTSTLPGVVFSNQNGLITEVTIPSFIGTNISVQFSLTEEQASIPCIETDTVIITFYEIPHPDAGLDTAICGKYVELNAFPTPGTDGYWQSILNAWYDPAVWPGDTVPCSSCANDANVVVYYPLENQTVTYYWMEFNGQCYGYDSVKIYFGSIQPANHLVDPSDSINCGRLTDLLAAEQPSYGNGYWYDEVSLTQFYPNNLHNNPDSTIISASSYGMHYFHWVAVNGSCRDTSDAIPIKFVLQPEANAGGNYWPGLFGVSSHIKTDTVCGLRYQLNSIVSIGNGLWTILDPAYTWFESSGTSAPTVYYNDIINRDYYTVFNAPYYRDLVWLEDNQTCTDKDTLRLYFAPIPSGNFTATMPACRYDSSMIVAHTWPLPNNVDYGITYFGWDIGNGIVWDTAVNIFDESTIYVNWESGNSHTVTLSTINQWECYSTINQKVITEPALFAPDYAINPATCDNNNGEIILYTDINTFSFEWWDSTIVSTLDTGQYGLIPGHNYEVVVTGQSLSPDAGPGTLCHDTISITMTNSGITLASFDTMFVHNQSVPRTIQLLNSTINGYTYSWRIYDNIGNLVNLSTVENPSYTFTIAGCYRIVLVSTSRVDTSWFGIERFGCKDTFEYKWLCFNPTGIEDIIQGSISVYPNPANEFIYIDFNGIENIEKYSVLDVFGRKKLEGTMKQNDQTILINELSSGVYFINFTTSDKTSYIGRFIKE